VYVCVCVCACAWVGGCALTLALPLQKAAQFLAIVNTVLSLLGSVLSAFGVSALVSGGVVVGCVYCQYGVVSVRLCAGSVRSQCTGGWYG
jgi:hypothetical protein